MQAAEQLFFGLQVFSGGAHLPQTLRPTPADIATWALENGLVLDPEFQLLGSARADEIAKVCTPDDRMLVAIAIDPDAGELGYFEYPYIPVRSLIRRGQSVELLYWSVPDPNAEWSDDWPPQNDARFAFSIPGCSDEFCSTTTGQLIVPKLSALLDSLGSEFDVKMNIDGGREITVDGEFTARFLKSGRSFDVVLERTSSA